MKNILFLVFFVNALLQAQYLPNSRYYPIVKNFGDSLFYMDVNGNVKESKYYHNEGRRLAPAPKLNSLAEALAMSDSIWYFDFMAPEIYSYNDEWIPRDHKMDVTVFKATIGDSVFFFNQTDRLPIMRMSKELDHIYELHGDRPCRADSLAVLGLDSKFSDATLSFKDYRFHVFFDGVLVAQNWETKLFGVLNDRGEILIPFKYKRIHPMLDSVCLIKTNADSLYYFDLRKNIKIGPTTHIGNRSNFKPLKEIEVAFGFERGMVMYYDNDKWGILDRSGNVVLPPTYEYMTGLFGSNNNLRLVRKNGKMGVVDAIGKVLVPLEYDTIHAFKRYDGGMVCQKGSLYYLLDENFKVRSSKSLKKIEVITAENGGIIIYRQGRKYGLMDENFNKVTPPKFDQYHNMCNGMVWMAKSEKVDYRLFQAVDKNGRVVFSKQNLNGEEGDLSLFNLWRVTEFDKLGIALGWEYFSNKCKYIDKRGKILATSDFNMYPNDKKFNCDCNPPGFFNK